MSVARFGGWEPTTYYTRDAADRIVSSTPETEWTPLQQGWMLALAEYEAGHCGECGSDLSEATSTEPEDWGIPPGYPKRCAPCTRIAIEQAEFGEEGTKHLHAQRWAVIRKPQRRR